MGCYPAPCGRVSRLCILDRVLPHRTLLQGCLMGTRQILSARDDFKRAYSKKQARYETDVTLWHTRRRGGVVAGREAGTQEGTTSTGVQCETATQPRAVQHAGAGRPCLLTYWPAVGDRKRGTSRRRLSTHEPVCLGRGRQYPRRGQAEDHAKASWRARAGAIGGARKKWLEFLSPASCLPRQPHLRNVEQMGSYVCVLTGAVGPRTVRSSVGSSPSETPAPAGRACKSSWWRHLCAPITPGPCECHTLPSANALRNCGGTYAASLASPYRCA